MTSNSHILPQNATQYLPYLFHLIFIALCIPPSPISLSYILDWAMLFDGCFMWVNLSVFQFPNSKLLKEVWQSRVKATQKASELVATSVGPSAVVGCTGSSGSNYLVNSLAELCVWPSPFEGGMRRVGTMILLVQVANRHRD